MDRFGAFAAYITYSQTASYKQCIALLFLPGYYFSP